MLRKKHQTKRGGLKFSANVHKPKFDDMYTTKIDPEIHDIITQQILEKIYSYCDEFTLLNAYDTCEQWRLPFIDPKSNLIAKFKFAFQNECKEMIRINETWSSFNQHDKDPEFWRYRFFIRHACLRRCRDALTFYINEKLLSDFESDTSKFHSKEYKFRQDLLHWDDMDETEKDEFHKSFLFAAQNFGKKPEQDHNMWERTSEPVSEYWELDKDQVSYSGKLMGFYIEVKIKCGGPVWINFDEVNLDKFSGMHDSFQDEGNDLSVSFVDEAKYQTSDPMMIE
jgi:hypothetical protein